MKVYQIKNHEILISEVLLNEERFVEQYKNLFEEILLIGIISNKRIFQCINLCNHSASSKTLVIEPLLRKNILPPFQFLVCKN